MSDGDDPQPFGRVDPDGTVYVRTATGERAVGQVPDVPTEEALAFFTRRYDALELEVSLLERRVASGALSPDDVSATTLAGEAITGKLTEAPGNGAKIGGLKVTTESAWFAARPSGTEDVYKIYAESFRGAEHLAQVQDEAREVVSAALRG